MTDKMGQNLNFSKSIFNVRNHLNLSDIFFSLKNIDLREHFQCNLGFSWNFFSSNSVDMLKNLLTTESRRTGKLCGQWCRIWRTIFNSRVFWCFWYCKKKFRKIWFFVSTEMGLVIQLKSWKEEFSLNHKETC